MKATAPSFTSVADGEHERSASNPRIVVHRQIAGFDRTVVSVVVSSEVVTPFLTSDTDGGLQRRGLYPFSRARDTFLQSGASDPI